MVRRAGEKRSGKNKKEPLVARMWLLFIAHKNINKLAKRKLHAHQVVTKWD